MATLRAFGYMIAGDLRLERQGNALIVHSKHNARWFGALPGLTALIFLIFWIRGSIGMPEQSGLALLAYGFGVVIWVTLVGIGVFLSLPRKVTTTFDLRSHRVVHHVSIGRGWWYERRRTYPFAEVAGLRLNGYDSEPDAYMPVTTLQNGQTRWLSTANGGYMICATTIQAICAATGLQKLGVAYHR